MTIEQIAKFCGNNSAWKNPLFLDARLTFVTVMQGKQYGREQTLDAWNWFVTGYIRGLLQEG